MLSSNAVDAVYVATPTSAREEICVFAAAPAAVLMFEAFAAMVGNASFFQASVLASERTQEWLDAIWTSVVQKDRS